MTPGAGSPGAESAPAEVETPRAANRWYHTMAALLFVNFSFLLGVVLAAFPWLVWWDMNFFGDLTPFWRRVWMNPYFRGGVSGVGMLNIYISVVEIFRLRRFSG